MSGKGAAVEVVNEEDVQVVSVALGGLAVSEAVGRPHAHVANNSDQLVIPHYAYNFNTNKIPIDENQASGS